MLSCPVLSLYLQSILVGVHTTRPLHVLLFQGGCETEGTIKWIRLEGEVQVFPDEMT